jgi:hypothetical protein
LKIATKTSHARDATRREGFSKKKKKKKKKKIRKLHKVNARAPAHMSPRCRRATPS